ncbi:MAG TPA: Asp-tRNA(Asn)/Glu-tRNA(Gln) amidotransferase subunit GatB [Puia sp.]|nr:Asp-tRNA(Asn)/Glu-tRNA(Gln) amidotransferase subunit GatB [Puia sp.]
MSREDHITIYETVVGLEVHAQLSTQTKLFCGDSAAFGAEPNTEVSPISIGLPGTLPVLNRKAIEYAIRIGLACECAIEPVNYFARKHYFYPDLPKGYQISQHTTPICKGGFVRIQAGSTQKKVRLNRIHLEEDAGKNIHDNDTDYSSIDLNRAGVPLIEIVTEPEISSGAEAVQFLTELRRILRYLEICDGNMEEGSMRCDANVSIRPLGDKTLGTKVEVKNLNSIRNVRRAIEFEAQRMAALLDAGGAVVQQTRSFDAGAGITFPLRDKEEANDYRYFPDPDLPPFYVTESLLEKVRNDLPPLPEQLVEKLTREFHLPEYDARVICDDRETAAYFMELTKLTNNYKAAANWLLGPVKSYTNEHSLGFSQVPLSPAGLARLIDMVDEKTISFSTASKQILPRLMDRPGADPREIASALNILQNSDDHTVAAWVDEVLARMPEKVSEYKKGKKGLMGLFIGEVKKISKGKADPKLTNKLLQEKLDKK